MLNFHNLGNGLPYPFTEDKLLLYKHVSKQYADKTLLEFVNELIPIEIRREFNKTRRARVDSLILLKSLLYWFKNEFMRWMSKTSICPTCKSSMDSRSTKGNSWIVRSVEYYQCSLCNFSLIFPRYGEIENIAINRLGRCSEWSFLFGAILNSLSIQSRIVHDFLDHCWNEAFIDGKWIHVDSTLDYPISINNPHYYEKNWNKKYQYVMAFSNNEITDVTKDYSFEWKTILERRKKRKNGNMTRIINYYNKI